MVTSSVRFLSKVRCIIAVFYYSSTPAAFCFRPSSCTISTSMGVAAAAAATESVCLMELRWLARCRLLMWLAVALMFWAGVCFYDIVVVLGLRLS